MYNNNYYQPPRNLGIQTNYQQPIYQPMYQVPISQPTSSGLQGKIVDSIETAKNQDIQLDGSISYFALTDGTAIVSKQLQADGTSKTTIYRPIDEEQGELPKYATLDDIKKEIEMDKNLTCKFFRSYLYNYRIHISITNLFKLGIKGNIININYIYSI